MLNSDWLKWLIVYNSGSDSNAGSRDCINALFLMRYCRYSNGKFTGMHMTDARDNLM